MGLQDIARFKKASVTNLYKGQPSLDDFGSVRQKGIAP